MAWLLQAKCPFCHQNIRNNSVKALKEIQNININQRKLPIGLYSFLIHCRQLDKGYCSFLQGFPYSYPLFFQQVLPSKLLVDFLEVFNSAYCSANAHGCRFSTVKFNIKVISKLFTYVQLVTLRSDFTNASELAGLVNAGYLKLTAKSNSPFTNKSQLLPNSS